MSTVIVKHILYQNCFKMYTPLKISINLVSNSKKLYAKKRFVMKNNFTFQKEILHNQSGKTTYESRTTSPNSSFGPKESSLDYDDLSAMPHEFISTDLLASERTSKEKNLKRITQPKKNNKPSLSYQGEILFGVHPVHLALLKKKRTFYHLFLREEIDSLSENNKLKSEIVRLAKSMNIPFSHVDTRGLKILAPGAVHQGLCLDAGFLPLPTWKEDQSKSDLVEKNSLWLVLDEIIDPMNVGAIIRSAYYFGVDKLFTVRGNSCKLSPTVSKASSGSLEVMDIYQIDNLEDFIKCRKDNGWCIISTVAYSEKKFEFDIPLMNAVEFNTSEPTILILGNEGRGVSEAVLKLCNSLISIEPGQTLSQGIDSLNVSVAAGVLLYVLNSQIKNVKS